MQNNSYHPLCKYCTPSIALASGALRDAGLGAHTNLLWSFSCHSTLGSSFSICNLPLIFSGLLKGMLCFGSSVTLLQGKSKILLHRTKCRPDTLSGLQPWSETCWCKHCVLHE